jgi:hypothetical protein
MLTEEVYTVLDEMDRRLNAVFYQICQLRVLGNLFFNAEPHDSTDFSAGCFINDYCVPAVSGIESLQESIDTLKSCLKEVQP